MNDVRSPEQIEREIAELRAQISDTLDAVQMKVSPGQLLDQALSYAKDGGNTLAINLGRGMRDNPVPAALFGISLGWLFYSGTRAERAPERPRTRRKDDGASERLRDAREGLARVGDDMAQMGSDVVQYAKSNPATTAAIAVTAGALISSLLLSRRRR